MAQGRGWNGITRREAASYAHINPIQHMDLGLRYIVLIWSERHRYYVSTGLCRYKKALTIRDIVRQHVYDHGAAEPPWYVASHEKGSVPMYDFTGV